MIIAFLKIIIISQNDIINSLIECIDIQSLDYATTKNSGKNLPFNQLDS